MKILFANLSSLVFDVATPEREPLGGSESCLCYLARQLAQKGHDVTLAARLPSATPDKVLGVRHRPVAVIREKEFFEAEKFEAIVTGNAAIACPRFREYSPAALNIFWDHLPPAQAAIRPLSHPTLRQSIDGIVYVSSWQKIETEKAFGMTMPSCIIANGVAPSFENMFASARDLLAAKRNRAAYTSVPDRGLAELLDAAEGLPGEMTLDVFSSMRVYQTGDVEHEAVLQRVRDNPRVTYHGSVAQSELAVKLKPAAFLAYPCVTPETFCLAALEALAAGMQVIASDAGGIKTTTMGFADLLPVRAGDRRDAFVLGFRQLLAKNIAGFTAQPEAWAEQRFEQMQVVNRQCTWAVRATEWENMLAALGRNKSEVETRRSSG